MSVKLRILQKADYKAYGSKNISKLSINKKGHIRFNSSFLKKLYLQPGQKLNFQLAQDEKRAKDWYIIIGDSPNSFSATLKAVGDSLTASFCNKHIAMEILQSIEFDKNYITLRIAEAPIEFDGFKCYAILTAAIAS